MAAPRFYLPPEKWTSSPLTLEGDEAHHCHSVMRRSTGDEIQLFNGAGRSLNATIISSSSKKIQLQPISNTDHHTPPPTVQISLLQAIPKGSNMELIIEKAVELGVQHIHPTLTTHTVVKLNPNDIAKKQAKWQRLTIEACKQCGQNWLPTIHPPTHYTQAWQQLPQHDLRLIAALLPQAKHLKHHLTPSPSSILIAIGPEGDFSPAEYQLALDSGCQPITLGHIILRVETATLFCLSIIANEYLNPKTTKH